MPSLALDDVAALGNTRFVLRLPLAWLNEVLEPALQTDPELYRDLMRLDQFQMHVVALAAAHVNSELSVEMAQFLLRKSAKAIISQTIAHSPEGMKRALTVLPGWVMPA